jgi:hypothetical protein
MIIKESCDFCMALAATSRHKVCKGFHKQMDIIMRGIVSSAETGARRIEIKQPTKELVREVFVFTDVLHRYDDQLRMKLSGLTIKKNMLSKVAVAHNLSPNVFGTYSFRISGAITLNSGHVETDIIQKLGGLRSNTTKKKDSTRRRSTHIEVTKKLQA